MKRSVFIWCGFLPLAAGLLLLPARVHAGPVAALANRVAGAPAAITDGPNKLTEFTAVYHQHQILLKWSIFNEDDFTHFIIERSMNGAPFTAVAQVNAHTGPYKSRHYAYQEAQPALARGRVLYRVSCMETGRTPYYSRVNMVMISDELLGTGIRAFPNPVKEQLQVVLSPAWKGRPVVLELFAANGNRVYRANIGSAGPSATIAMHTLVRGIYFVKAVCGTEGVQAHIVKD